ncbi:MAG: PH domain-containing protein [Syntrophomonadaceae bacterium]|nr:PH domain-containing protein [Syntrophomonadaceae bacterium]
MYFSPKRDLWLGIVLLVGVGIPLTLLLYHSRWFDVLLAAPFTLFVGWVWTTTGYTISPTELQVKAGPLQWKIPLESIQRVRRSRSMTASPALSFDRLEISYGRGDAILIAPAETREFLNVLRQRCPGADIQ